MMTLAIWIGAALFWVTSWAPSAWATPPDATPNLLLITIDTLRRDHCSVYGYVHDTTPHLREIAERGARFALAFAPAPSTAPTHASILTGLYPPSHRLIRKEIPRDSQSHPGNTHIGEQGEQEKEPGQNELRIGSAPA